MQSLTLIGVVPVGPESFLCALLQRPDDGKVIPVWLPPFEGAQLAARLDGWQPNRPRAVDVMADILRDATPGIESIELSSYYNGTFIATATLIGGTEIDLRASDALLLAVEMDMEIQVDDAVAAQASMYLSKEDAQTFLGDAAEDLAEPLEDEEHVSASGDAQADADFEELMRNLGVDDTLFDD